MLLAGHQAGRGYVRVGTRRKDIGVRVAGIWGLALAIVEQAVEEGDAAAIEEWKEWLDERHMLANTFRSHSRATVVFARMTPVAHGDESVVYLREQRRKRKQ